MRNSIAPMYCRIVDISEVGEVVSGLMPAGIIKPISVAINPPATSSA